MLNFNSDIVNGSINNIKDAKKAELTIAQAIAMIQIFGR